MATTTGPDALKLHITGLIHVFHAPVDTTVPDISTFDFSDVMSTGSFGDWTWLGDTSSENLIELASDGGDAEYKRTADRLKVRAVREDTTYTLTINTVGISRDHFELGFSDAEYDEATNSYRIKSGGTSSEKALLVVTEDGRDVAAVYLPNADIVGNLPGFDLENFQEWPLTCALLASPSTGDLMSYYLPRARAGAGGGGTGGAEGE